MDSHTSTCIGAVTGHFVSFCLNVFSLLSKVKNYFATDSDRRVGVVDLDLLTEVN